MKQLEKAELYSKINKLLTYLRSSNTVSLINEYYKPYNNEAPGLLTQGAMDDLQEVLNKWKT